MRMRDFSLPPFPRLGVFPGAMISTSLGGSSTKPPFSLSLLISPMVGRMDLSWPALKRVTASRVSRHFSCGSEVRRIRWANARRDVGKGSGRFGAVWESCGGNEGEEQCPDTEREGREGIGGSRNSTQFDKSFWLRSSRGPTFADASHFNEFPLAIGVCPKTPSVRCFNPYLSIIFYALNLYFVCASLKTSS